MDLIDNIYSIDELENYISNNELTSYEWLLVSRCQKLSEPFIEKYNDKVHWNEIVKSQALSYEFMEKHLYKYSLCGTYVYFCINLGHITKLRKKYSYKYYIDRLAYELQSA